MDNLYTSMRFIHSIWKWIQCETRWKIPVQRLIEILIDFHIICVVKCQWDLELVYKMFRHNCSILNPTVQKFWSNTLFFLSTCLNLSKILKKKAANENSSSNVRAPEYCDVICTVHELLFQIFSINKTNTTYFSLIANNLFHSDEAI